MAKPHAPITVSTGVLTQDEFEQLSLPDQESVERSTLSLLSRYGPEWLTRERERLRDELSFAYGTP